MALGLRVWDRGRIVAPPGWLARVARRFLPRRPSGLPKLPPDERPTLRALDCSPEPSVRRAPSRLTASLGALVVAAVLACSSSSEAPPAPATYPTPAALIGAI